MNKGLGVNIARSFFSVRLRRSVREIEITWKQIGKTLRCLEVEPTTRWLIDEVCGVILELELPRPASGKPKQVVGGEHSRTNHILLSSATSASEYTVDIVLPGKEPKRLLEDGTGVHASRRWFQQYIRESANPTVCLVEDEAVIDYCVDLAGEAGMVPVAFWYSIMSEVSH